MKSRNRNIGWYRIKIKQKQIKKYWKYIGKYWKVSNRKAKIRLSDYSVQINWTLRCLQCAIISTHFSLHYTPVSCGNSAKIARLLLTCAADWPGGKVCARQLKLTGRQIRSPALARLSPTVAYPPRHTIARLLAHFLAHSLRSAVRPSFHGQWVDRVRMHCTLA